MGFFDKIFNKNGGNRYSKIKIKFFSKENEPDGQEEFLIEEEPMLPYLKKAPIRKSEVINPASKAEKIKKERAKKNSNVKIETQVKASESIKNSEKKKADVPSPSATEAKSVRSGRFEIKKTKDDRFVFNLFAPNHIIVATSQVYSSSSAAINGIQSIISNAEKAPIEDNTLKNPTKQGFPKWEMYIDKGGEYRFRLFASNGNCVVHSQGYKQKSSCKNGIDSIIRCSKNAEIDKSYLK